MYGRILRCAGGLLVTLLLAACGGGGDSKDVNPNVQPVGAVVVGPDSFLLFPNPQVQPDGSLTQGEPFYRLDTWDENAASAADGLALDDQGNVYVATRTGLQVCDPSGIVTAIISKPQDGPISNVVFAGPDMQTIYVTAGDKVFKRHLRRKGIVRQ